MSSGQGYIWRVHKIPGSEKWELAMRSHELWEEMAESIRNQGMDPLLELGWKKTGPKIEIFLSKRVLACHLMDFSLLCSLISLWLSAIHAVLVDLGS